jgi:pyruvate dehydrogenase E1 component alpha subunit
VVFFCQNNAWAISTPTSQQSRAPLHQRGRGFGMDAHLVDGNDVLAVHAVTTAAVDAARQGGGPVLIEALTYRMAGHSTSDDPTRYRGQGEVDAWRARDPLDRLLTLMCREGWADPEFLAGVAAEADDLAAETRRACLAIARPPSASIFAHVYAEPTAPLVQQRDDHLSYLASFAPAQLIDNQE